MKILYYCQHVLGMGHFLRSLEIVKALDGHEVTLVTGGPETGLKIPDHVRVVQLPPLMMDEEFRRLLTASPNNDLDEVKHARKTLLWNTVKDFRPDVFVVELYPFGRNAFRFELKPILEGIRSGDLPPCRVACSLRDILVEKNDPAAYEKRVIEALASGFDAVLVHADPRFVRLEETFSRVPDIPVPVVYTGFITPRPEPGARNFFRKQLGLTAEDRLIVASIGGGKAGGALLSAVVRAVPLMALADRVRVEGFAGPFMDEDEYVRLKSTAGESIRISRFTDDFISHLAASDLSVSMAGYNTSLNVVAAGTRALFWPFGQNREQPRRAALLADLGAAGVLADEDLEPRRLAARLDAALSGPLPREAGLDLDGARHTAQWLTRWGKPEQPLKPERNSSRSSRSESDHLADRIERTAARALAASPRGRATVFFRADDVGVPSVRFERLIRLFRDRAVPLDLAVVPAWLNAARWNTLKGLTGSDKTLFCWHQHGYAHKNHEPVGKKSEFGPGRSETDIRRDIENGRRRLENILNNDFFPVFTPPWNRCTETALKVIADGGFLAVSRFVGTRPEPLAGLADWHADVDLHTRKEISEAERLAGIFGQIEKGLSRGRCGFMIHHRRMKTRDFHFLDTLLQTLSRINELHMVNYRELNSAD